MPSNRSVNSSCNATAIFAITPTLPFKLARSYWLITLGANPPGVQGFADSYSLPDAEPSYRQRRVS
jgi:hypothetical protein